MADLAPELKAALADLEALESEHIEVGSQVFAALDGKVFPCDCLVLSGIDRSLALLQGFGLLMSNGTYPAATHLLRSQLDTTLRVYAVLEEVDDPHDVAHALLSGTPLHQIKDKAGKRLRDARILDLLADRPIFREVYDGCSGFVHFSYEHALNFLRKCEVSSDGEIEFLMTPGDDHVSIQSKVGACRLFESMTRSVLGIGREWSKKRNQYGTNEVLMSRFGIARLPPT